MASRGDHSGDSPAPGSVSGPARTAPARKAAPAAGMRAWAATPAPARATPARVRSIFAGATPGRKTAARNREAQWTTIQAAPSRAPVAASSEAATALVPPPASRAVARGR